ncbi:MAG: polyprenol monophosphomannose synthase [Candidatus Aenigmatarchaeota archaeon]
MISVVLPTYNERKNLEEVVERICSCIEGDFEIVVVDDDSPDGTWELAEELSSEYKNLRSVRRREDRGLAKSVVRGFQESKGGRIVVMDADLQHPPEKIPELVEALEDNDLAVGSRKVEGGEVENWPWHREFVSFGAERIARFFLQDVNSVKDIMSGFFAVRKEVVENVNFNPIGYKILLEILVKCDYSSLKEIPYTFKDRETGSSSLGFRQYITYLRHLFRLCIYDLFC